MYMYHQIPSVSILPLVATDTHTHHNNLVTIFTRSDRTPWFCRACCCVGVPVQTNEWQLFTSYIITNKSFSVGLGSGYYFIHVN